MYSATQTKIEGNKNKTKKTELKFYNPIILPMSPFAN